MVENRLALFLHSYWEHSLAHRWKYHFLLIYFEHGQEKGSIVKGTRLFKMIQHLATIDFLYPVLFF